MLLFEQLNNAQVSLNDHSMNFNVKHGVSVRKQSVDERFNVHSVDFVKTLLQKQLTQQIYQIIDVKILEPFTSVKIKDSTRFQLPPNLKKNYAGCGGGASEAGIHIQFEFDVKTGKVSEIQPTDALTQDTTNAQQTIDRIEKGSLLIRDLGYFVINVFEEIEKRGAYYISRLQPKVKIYEFKAGQYHELDLVKEHQRMKNHGILRQEKQVYIGEKNKHQTRLIMELLPEEVVASRLSKANKEAKKKGRTLSKKYKAYASFNFFITNVPEHEINTEQVHLLYQLRWQIELRFKCRKGLCEIHEVKKMKQERFETYLYARLLYILINWEIVVGLNNIWFNANNQLLSIYKCFKVMLISANKLRDALFNPQKYLQTYIETLYGLCKNNLVLEKRKGHISYEEILLLKNKKQPYHIV
jgi:hypothetical protein